MVPTGKYRSLTGTGEQKAPSFDVVQTRNTKSVDDFQSICQKKNPDVGNKTSLFQSVESRKPVRRTSYSPSYIPGDVHENMTRQYGSGNYSSLSESQLKSSLLRIKDFPKSVHRPGRVADSSSSVLQPKITKK